MSKELAEGTDLYRYVYPGWIRADGISSAAFDGEELSCDDASLCTATDTHARLDASRGGGVARFAVGFARREEQQIVPDPLLTNAAHVLVRGKKNKTRRRAFAREAERRGWAFPPTAPPVEP